MPDQFVIRLKKYLAKWLELSGSSSGNFDALVDLIVKEQFINACSEELAMYLLERVLKDLVELTTWAEWAQKYLIAQKQQLGGKSKATVHPRCADQKKSAQSKPEVARVLRFGYRQSECGTKITPGKDQEGTRCKTNLKKCGTEGSTNSDSIQCCLPCCE